MTTKNTNKTVKFVDNKKRDNRDNNKAVKKKIDSSNNKKNKMKSDSVNEIQVSDSNLSIGIEDNDSVG